jgi:hypothetical protein
MLIPVKLVIKFDKQEKFYIAVKLLWFEFDLNDFETNNNSLFKRFKKESGIDQAKADAKKQNKAKEFIEKLNDNFSLICSLLQRVTALLKKCTVEKLYLKVVCAEDDAAKTAISYGRAYALLSPFVTFIHSLMKVKNKGKDLSITCDYDSKDSIFELCAVISVRIFRILAVLLKIAIDISKNKPK